MVGNTEYRTRTERWEGAETGRKERSNAAGRHTQRSGSRSARELAERTRSARPCASCAAHSLSRVQLRVQARKRASARERAARKHAWCATQCARTLHPDCARRAHACPAVARAGTGGRAGARQ